MIDFRRFAGQLLAHVRVRYTTVTQSKLAEDLHYSRDHIASVESGRRGLSVKLGEALDGYFELPGVFVTTAEELERHPNPFASLTELERSAAALRLWDERVVPALLQTADYAGALLKDAQLVDERLTRQKDVSGAVTCVLDEGVLWHPFGGVKTFTA